MPIDPLRPAPSRRSLRRRAAVALGTVLAGLLGGCSAGPDAIDDPAATLADVERSTSRHLAALDAVAATPDPDQATLDVLHRLLWVPGYTNEARERALEVLEIEDPEGLQQTIRQRLPRLTNWSWLTRLSEIVAERGWRQQTPALVSSWGRPTDDDVAEWDRPEAKAMVAMYGRESTVDEVFELMVASNRPSDQGLRTRCWDLLQRLDERDRLVALLAEDVDPDEDLMLADLSAAARDLGLVPMNREEILWLRSLRQPEHAGFWAEASLAVADLPAERRTALEVRDLPVVVAAARHEPGILAVDTDELRVEVARDLSSARTADRRDAFGVSTMPRTIDRAGDDLTWGDLAAIRMARQALAVPQVVAHLFDYAERDRADESTEYGGLIRLDDAGRFEVLEYPPRIRHHDEKFIASQAMFDAGYTAQFHFHFHAQRHSNRDYAGPALGDWKYADATRTNCLVMTFLDERSLNVDYYRHGRLIVDLGTVRRP